MEERLKPKVYINPNYKPLHGSNMTPLHQHNTIHINQNFSRKKEEQHHSVNKIFINPNFMKTKQDKIQMPCVANQNLACDQSNFKIPEHTHDINVSHDCLLQSQTLDPSSSKQLITVSNTNNTNTSIKSRYSFVRTSKTRNENTNSTQKNNICQVKLNTKVHSPLVKSRYQLIRNNVNREPSDDSHQKSRLKISKYKVVTVNNTEKNAMNTKNNRARCMFSNVSLNKTLRSDVTTQSHLNIFKVRNLKPSLLGNKYVLEVKRKTYQNIIENIKGKTKINNIPCPLFSKYGKCLRKNKGKCEYLHNKKHVALCRQFLNGVCHNENCCFSHELSMKKMPTCYFYLKGMCFKDNCPYLHVKLSEKTKVCQDFLRGYCEKGQDCSFRHVKLQIKRKLKSQVHFSPNTIKKILRVTNRKSRKTIETDPDVVPDKIIAHSELNSKEKSTSETRYYKKIDEDNPNCDFIKPTRCKLGTLPAFIQL